MVDKVATYRDKGRGKYLYNSLAHLIHLEELEDIFWEITHLVGMLHEIERKWNINLPADELFRDTTTTVKTTTTKKTRPKKPPRERDINKSTKKPRKITPFLLKEFFEWTSTLGPTPRWKFRNFDYGWELSYDWWNVHPVDGRQKWEDKQFYYRHPLPMNAP